MTTKLLAFTAAAFLAMPGAAGAQAVSGYGFAGRAAIVDEDGLLLTHYGGGLDLISGSGLGASIEAGRMGRNGVWINHVSVDGTYHWGRTGRRVTPFVAAGYSRFFADGEAANTFNVGGGVDVWVARRVGIRLDVRDHVDPSKGSVHVPSVRFGATVHLW
jgi:hypothetical protein